MPAVADRPRDPELFRRAPPPPLNAEQLAAWIVYAQQVFPDATETMILATMAQAYDGAFRVGYVGVRGGAMGVSDLTEDVALLGLLGRSLTVVRAEIARREAASG
jgi:hypothetical protein